MPFLKLLRSSVISSQRSLSRLLSTEVHVEYREPLQRGKWDLWSAVCLERLPIISRDLNEIETKYQRHVLQVENELSAKSNHELAVQEAIKRRNAKVVSDVDENVFDNAQEKEDKWADYAEKIRCAPRKSELDNINDKKSLNRKLDKNLILVVKQKLGNSHPWVLPQVKHLDGESMRQTAERVITSLLGPSLKVTILGNAPSGYYEYKYPVSSEAESIGAKVFFFKAFLNSGMIEEKTDTIIDHCWLTRKEMFEKLKRNYSSAVNKMLINEDY